MYVILVYDVCERRVFKVLKICREYLHRIQNSVFEAQISQSNFKELIRRLKKVMDLEVDSLIVFKFRSEKVFKREVLGIEKFPIEFML